MMKSFLFFACFAYSFCCSQNQLERIELEHSNSIIIGSTIKITIQPLKKVKNSRMTIVVESKSRFDSRKLSKKEYVVIKDAVLKIDPKILYPDNGKDSLMMTCLDGYDTTITIFRNNKKEQYIANCLYKMDKYTNRKHLYRVAKLIFQAGRVKIKGMDDQN